jgi:flagellar FliL protein
MAKEEQAATEGEGGGGGGGGKKKMIIIGAAVGVAVIIAVVVFMMMGKSKKEPAKEGEAKPEAAAAGGHGAPPAAGAAGAAAPAAPAAAGAAGGSNIFPLEPFIVNIYDGQELRYLKVKVELEMANPATKAELDLRLAPVRDSVLVLLSTKTLQEVQDMQGKNQLKEQILSSINKFMAPGAITKIYFTDFVVQ